MALHGSTPYPLRQDLPMNCDLFVTTTRLCPSPSAALSGEPSLSSMPSLNPPPTSLPRTDCLPQALYEDQDDLEWHAFQECNPYYQESINYQTCPDSNNSWCQGPIRFSAPAKTTNGFPWDDGFPHESSLQYSSSACPRSYPHDLSLDINSCIASDADAYPPSAYHLDSQPQASITACHQSRLQDNSYTDSIQDAPGVRLENGQYQRNSPVPSHASICTGKVEMCAAVSPASVEGFEGIDCVTTHGDETDGDASISSEPYAQLIYKALMSAPEHKMVLKEIYEWFEKNTDKAKNNSSKGWQNSIRHNLSMNGVSWAPDTNRSTTNDWSGQAFKKVDQLPPSDESKKGFIWVLEPSAVNEGVKSTTRYRKSAPNKKIGKSENPAPQRQRSGAKGGKAARKAAKLRRSARLEDPDQYRLMTGKLGSLKPVTRSVAVSQGLPSSTDADMYQTENAPYQLHIPVPILQQPVGDSDSLSFGDITGCVTAYPQEPLFYDESERGDASVCSEYPLSHCKDDFWDLSLLTD